jgi:hypothetical protein
MKMNQLLSALGLLDFTMLRLVLTLRAFWNLWTVYFFNFPLFFSGRGKPRITETTDTESVDTGARLYYDFYTCELRTSRHWRSWWFVKNNLDARVPKWLTPTSLKNLRRTAVFGISAPTNQGWPRDWLIKGTLRSARWIWLSVCRRIMQVSRRSCTWSWKCSFRNSKQGETPNTKCKWFILAADKLAVVQGTKLSSQRKRYVLICCTRPVWNCTLDTSETILCTHHRWKYHHV